MTVAGFSAEDLVKWAVLNAKPHRNGTAPRWVAVMDTFALGSTSGHEICRAFGLNPDDEVSGVTCIACNP